MFQIGPKRSTMAEDNDSNGVSVEHEKNDTENSEKAHELNNVKDADLMDLSGKFLLYVMRSSSI